MRCPLCICTKIKKPRVLYEPGAFVSFSFPNRSLGASEIIAPLGALALYLFWLLVLYLVKIILRRAWKLLACSS